VYYYTMHWPFLNIDEPNITHIHGVEFMTAPDITRLREYNIIHGQYQPQDGLRQDAQEGIAEGVVTMARQRPDETFIAVLDQGEHWLHDTPPNMHVFNRRFHAGGYNFQGDPPQAPRPERGRWIYCPMGRADHMRTQWFDLLVEHGLVRHNAVSYLCTDSVDRLPDAAEYTRTGGQHNIDMVPFNNFESDIPSNEARQGGNWTVMQDCLIGISVETGSTQGQAWYNERIYNMLGAGLMPVCVAGARAMGELENMGFRLPTAIDWRPVDLWTIDNQAAGMDKMQHMVRAMAEVCDGDLDTVAREWHPNAVHNHRHMTETLPRLHEQEEKHLARFICTITHNLSNRKYQKIMS